MHPCGSHAIIGKKGGGKSFLATKLATRVLGETNRVVFTNLPLKLPELREYMQLHWPNFTDDIHERVWIEPEVKVLKRFWLHRGFGWCVRDVTKDEFKLGARLDYREAYRWVETTGPVGHRKPIVDLFQREIEGFCEGGEMERKPIADLRPVQFIIDEIQNIFPARSFSQTSEGALFWMSQQRKLTDDFIWISQNSDLVDKEFRDLTDDWLYITNWGRKRKSIFRLPKAMTWAKYDQRPGPGVAPMVQGSFRLDISGIGQCYDTSAGVGIEGGLAADKKEGVGGIHWSWIFVFFALFVVGAFQVPKLISKGAVKLFTSHVPKAGPLPTNAPVSVASISPPPSNHPLLAAVVPGANGNVKDFRSHRLSGVCVFGGVARAFFDDGDQVASTDLRFGGLVRSGGKVVGAVIDGKREMISP